MALAVMPATALAVGVVLAASVAPEPSHAASFRPFDFCLHELERKTEFISKDCLGILLWDAPNGTQQKDGGESPSPAARQGPRAATYILTTLGSGLSKGEPTFGGKMKNSIWGHMDPDRPSRVVLSTFGSDIDTALAAYRIEVNQRGKVSYDFLGGNDDAPVPGVGRGWSLLTVDLEKGRTYGVQIGGEDGTTSDRVALTATAFGPKGGVSAFLLSTTAGATMQNRDYVCEQRPCPDATFILHNSSKSRATVTPATKLKRFFDAPKPIILRPGEVAVVTFAGRDFVNTNGVAEAGAFTFAAIAKGKPLESAEKGATVFLADPNGSQAGLEMSAGERFKAGYVNEPLRFAVKLRNAGSDTARGCGFRSFQSNFRNVLTRFRQIDKSGKPAGDWGEPADLPAGDAQSFEVEIASIAPRQGDPDFGLADEVLAGCVNRQPPQPDLLNTLEVNADGSGVYTAIDARIAGGGELSVPAQGQASFDVRAKNRLRTASIVARPRYVYPFDAYDPDAQYGVSVCRLDTRGKCDGPKGFTTAWTSDRGDEASFRIFVKAPKKRPSADAGRYRIYLNFEGVRNEWPNLFGAESVAVKIK